MIAIFLAFTEYTSILVMCVELLLATSPNYFLSLLKRWHITMPAIL